MLFESVSKFPCEHMSWISLIPTMKVGSPSVVSLKAGKPWALMQDQQDSGLHGNCLRACGSRCLRGVQSDCI